MTNQFKLIATLHKEPDGVPDFFDTQPVDMIAQRYEALKQVVQQESFLGFYLAMLRSPECLDMVVDPMFFQVVRDQSSKETNSGDYQKRLERRLKLLGMVMERRDCSNAKKEEDIKGNILTCLSEKLKSNELDAKRKFIELYDSFKKQRVKIYDQKVLEESFKEGLGILYLRFLITPLLDLKDKYLYRLSEGERQKLFESIEIVCQSFSDIEDSPSLQEEFIQIQRKVCLLVMNRIQMGLISSSTSDRLRTQKIQALSDFAKRDTTLTDGLTDKLKTTKYGLHMLGDLVCKEAIPVYNMGDLELMFMDACLEMAESSEEVSTKLALLELRRSRHDEKLRLDYYGDLLKVLFFKAQLGDFSEDTLAEIKKQGAELPDINGCIGVCLEKIECDELNFEAHKNRFSPANLKRAREKMQKTHFNSAGLLMSGLIEYYYYTEQTEKGAAAIKQLNYKPSEKPKKAKVDEKVGLPASLKDYLRSVQRQPSKVQESLPPPKKFESSSTGDVRRDEGASSAAYVESGLSRNFKQEALASAGPSKLKTTGLPRPVEPDPTETLQEDPVRVPPTKLDRKSINILSQFYDFGKRISFKDTATLLGNMKVVTEKKPGSGGSHIGVLFTVGGMTLPFTLYETKDHTLLDYQRLQLRDIFTQLGYDTLLDN